MSVHTFKILFANGEKITRAEWGRTRAAALRTLRSIYGESIRAIA